jgi:hypothetical protein
MTKPVVRKAPETQSVRQRTYIELKNLILTGQLRPAERVAESRLASTSRIQASTSIGRLPKRSSRATRLLLRRMRGRMCRAAYKT